jgi:hypothetical protein
MTAPKIQGLNRPHHCPDWDFAFIRPGDQEMDCCTCPEHDAPAADEKEDCNLCVHADFDAEDPHLCWRDGMAVGMPAHRCEHYQLSDCYTLRQALEETLAEIKGT